MTYNGNKLSLTRSRYQRAGQLLQSRALHDRSGWHRDSRTWTKLTYAGYNDWCSNADDGQTSEGTRFTFLSMIRTADVSESSVQGAVAGSAPSGRGGRPNRSYCLMPMGLRPVSAEHLFSWIDATTHDHGHGWFRAKSWFSSVNHALRHCQRT